MKRINRVNAKVIAAIVNIIAAFIILVWSNHIRTVSTKNNASPEVLFQKDPSIDFIVYQSSAYVNSRSIGWIQELKLVPEKELGTVQRTGMKKNYEDFDATKLTKGTVIYIVKDRKDILLVLINSEYIPYYLYAEG